MDLMAEVATTRILLVDDDVELAELVGEYLTREGFTLDAETDGTHALDRAISGDYTGRPRMSPVRIEFGHRVWRGGMDFDD